MSKTLAEEREELRAATRELGRVVWKELAPILEGVAFELDRAMRRLRWARRLRTAIVVLSGAAIVVLAVVAVRAAT